MSTTGKEYKLAIRIAGVIDKSFTTSLATANSTLKANITAIDKNFTTLDKGFNSIMKTGQKCFSAIATAAGVATVAIAAATAAAISVGVDFETAFAGVKKTVEATEEEYEQLRQSILDMASEIPSSASDIAGVMEIAGQLGIANESLVDFTETMINLGVSTNMTAEDAATALARFANIMNMDDYGADGVSNFERLGSAVVDLGNNFATTEQEIVDVAESLAAAGNLASMSEADIMGISAAMSSVGLTADSGASSMSRLIMQMQQAVAEGGDELADYADVVGMTSSQFADLFREDAADAVVEFIGGLSEAGEGSYDILEDLGLSTIRLRKTFLSLAGADDLMAEAIEMANEAWDENTALTIEASKRYETAESKIQLMKNAFSELGIVAYDELREPFVDVIDTITNKVSGLTEDLGGANGISKWIEDIGTELPTLQRKFKKYGEPVFDFILDAGKWIFKNGDAIISVLAGIGGALAAYKVASTISHIVTAIMSLGSMNPVTLAILGVVAAIGLLVGAVTAYKQYEQDLIDSNLASHFGDIALSMEEIQKIAEYIVSSDSLGGVKEALEAFEDLDAISATMESSISEINKMNWKVSIGMELTEDEQEQYKTAIEEYVTAAQEYALQSQYAVSLNLAIAFGDGENSSVVDKVNQFYADKYDELSALGTKLNEAVTEAFNDGLLDIKETQIIAEIQAQMAAIEESLATGEFDAQLSILGMEYAGGGSLTAESFQNLQAELAEQVEEATVAYKEAYAKNYAAIQATYEAGGYLTGAEYEAALASIQEEYLKNIGDLQAKAINFQTETIMTQYADEVEAFKEVFESALAEYSEYDWETTPGPTFDAIMQNIVKSDALSNTTKKAIEELLTVLEPTAEQAEELKQRYADMGIELSDELANAFANLDLLGAMTVRHDLIGRSGDIESLADLMYSEIVNNESYSKIEETLRGYGWELPEELAGGIKEAIPPVVAGMYAWSQETIDEYYSNGFTTEADVSITLNPKMNGYLSSFRSTSILDQLQINQRANGGLATKPELTTFAENGPEMAIPIDGSKNAISLWAQTGRLLGMDSVLDGLSLDAGGSNTTIEYKPTLQFYGEAPSKDDIADALRVSQDEFDSLMERYIKTHGRVSFG